MPLLLLLLLVFKNERNRERYLLKQELIIFTIEIETDQQQQQSLNRKKKKERKQNSCCFHFSNETIRNDMKRLASCKYLHFWSYFTPSLRVYYIIKNSSQHRSDKDKLEQLMNGIFPEIIPI